MSENKDILTDLFRDRLGDYQQPVGEDVWTKIEQDLSSQKKKKAIPFFFLGKSFGMGVAATLALLIGLFVFKNSENNVPEQPVALNRPVETKKSNTISITDNKINSKKTGEKHLLADNSNQTVTKPVQFKTLIEATQTSGKIEEKENVGQLTIVETKPFVENLPASPSPKINKPENPKKPEMFKKPNENISLKKKKEKRWAFALLTTNSNSSSSFSENSSRQTNTFSETHTETYTETIKIPNPDKKGDVTAGNPNIPDYITKIITKTREVTSNYDLVEMNYTSTGIDYNIPFTIGLSVRKNLTDRWAVESGLAYTYLSSTETYQLKSQQNKVVGTNTQTILDQNSTIQIENELNYMGIPLKVVYSFLNKKNLSLYAGAGGMGEMCVYGKTTDTETKESQPLDIDQIQWSVLANFGVNYYLFDHFGLFIEPGVAYYFDDNSEVETIRKDKPFNFNFQAGIRLSF